MPSCPRQDCDLELVASEFAAPGCYECPVHGGPIWFEEQLYLVGEVALADNTKPTELQFFINKFTEMSAFGILYTVDHDMAGKLPTVVTVENMPPDNIDVSFLFTPETGKWMGVKARIDRRITV